LPANDPVDTEAEAKRLAIALAERLAQEGGK
jgi:hypothetical protein